MYNVRVNVSSMTIHDKDVFYKDYLSEQEYDGKGHEEYNMWAKIGLSWIVAKLIINGVVVKIWRTPN